MALYALNLFDLADNDDYLAYSRRSVAAVGKYGGKVVALGRLDSEATPDRGDTAPRQVMVLVEWPDRAAFEAFQDDPAHHDLHPLRRHGTRNYLWWAYERLEDLRPLLKR
ncbi:MAG TPA: DUF1330 domain-containing protein [Kofleriaceae bacterium]